VILSLPNCFEYVTALLAIWNLNAIAVPMANESLAHEIHRLFYFTESNLILHAGQYAEDLSDAKSWVNVNRVLSWDVYSTQRSLNPGESGILEGETPPGADATALIIFTSGTTGDPKGVELTHRNLISNCRSVIEYLGLTRNDRIYQVLPFYYSYGNSVLLTHLMVGGSVQIGKPIAFAGKVLEELKMYPCTGFSGVPSTYGFLLRQPGFSAAKTKLRYLTEAGGKMSEDLTVRLREKFPKTEIFIMYGQTEAAARLTYLPPDKLDQKPGSAGIALSGVELRIAGNDGHFLPAGEEGEVLARGDSIMRGYWKNPAATQKVLRDGWLYTGDLGYLDTDGFLFLTGRKSQMIKSGGHRIHPIEIEEVIMQLDDVIEAAVVGVSDDLLGEAIVVYVVSNLDEKKIKQQIMRHCKMQLPVFKQPKKVVPLKNLPKTSSGKVKKHELTAAG
jgi:acyl-CoA synthetase (AMP-forming)/AMP-acid ligase II